MYNDILKHCPLMLSHLTRVDVMGLLIILYNIQNICTGECSKEKANKKGCLWDMKNDYHFLFCVELASKLKKEEIDFEYVLQN